MVTLASLWLPILLAAILAFVASYVIHMVLRYHSTDYRRVANEDAAMDALRPLNLAPGDYHVPHGSPETMRDPAFIAKMKKGPVVLMTVFPSGEVQMGSRLVWWFVFCVVVSLFAAYVASRVLPAGTPYMDVFQITSTVAFVGYVMAIWPSTIWYNRPWQTNLKNTIDGLVYGLLTGGAFGWLWP
jgi:hypothetical protein